MELITNKKFFSENYITDIFLFITAIILLLATTLTIYLLCKHKKLRTLIASLVLHQVKEVGAVTQKEVNTECKTLTCISLALTILGLVMVAILHYRKSKLCRECTFSKAVKIMIFTSDVHYYVPIKLCKTAGSIHLFKIIGTLKPETIKLNQNYIWDTLEIDWKEVSVTFNDNKINLPRIKLRDKIKIRCLMKKEPLLFHIMLKQGITCFTLALGTQGDCINNTSETVYDNIDNFPDGLHSYARMQLCAWVLQVSFTGGDSAIEVKVKMMRGFHTVRRDHTIQVISCKPRSPGLHPYPSLIRKMQTHLELEGRNGNQLHTSTYQLGKTTSPQKTPVPKRAADKNKRTKTPIKRQFKVRLIKKSLPVNTEPEVVATTTASTQKQVVKPKAAAAKPSPIPLTVYNLSRTKVQEIPNPTIRKFQEGEIPFTPNYIIDI